MNPLNLQASKANQRIKTVARLEYNNVPHKAQEEAFGREFHSPTTTKNLKQYNYASEPGITQTDETLLAQL